MATSQHIVRVQPCLQCVKCDDAAAAASAAAAAAAVNVAPAAVSVAAAAAAAAVNVAATAVLTVCHKVQFAFCTQGNFSKTADYMSLHI